jgi:hypothetical protein
MPGLDFDYRHRMASSSEPIQRGQLRTIPEYVSHKLRNLSADEMSNCAPHGDIIVQYSVECEPCSSYLAICLRI